MDELTRRVLEFSAERGWQRYHSPKNLAMALTVEAAELLEIFQWKTEDESRSLPPKELEHARDEIGDVLLLTLHLAAKLGIDPSAAATAKLAKNAAKYPVEACYGRSEKYSELQGADR